jgi:type VI secretion system protein ImpG
MLDRYYEQELRHLRDLSVEFSKENPALAPMLSGPSTDPDVERLLEGVAFLVGLARHKLADGFPEFIQELARLLFPQYLRPIPCTTIMVFSATGKLNEPARVPAGVEINSVPVEGTACVFRTCYDVEVYPLALQDVQLVKSPGTPAVIKLSFELNGMALPQWKAASLRLFLAGLFPDAAKLFLLLSRHVQSIEISAPNGGSLSLPPEALKPVGFSGAQALLPYPTHVYPGYRLLQEYFVLPEKFFFLDLEGLDRWENRGAGTKFEMEFRLRNTPNWMPEIRRDSIVLHATPAINLFPYDASPILLDHRRAEYEVTPAGTNKAHYQIYTIDRIVGFRQGITQEKPYYPFGFFREGDGEETGTYHQVLKPSAVTRGTDFSLSVIYAPEEVPREETLSIRLTCTNGTLPESLLLGDISKPSGTSPERLAFRNLRPPTAYQAVPASDALLWRVLSHLSLNYFSLATAENLKALLHLYLFSEGHERGADVANRKRIDSILEVKAEAANRLISGYMMRGWNVRVKCQPDHFAGEGDMFLFGCILDHFLGCYAALNSYTRFELEDAFTGERYRWPERIGQQLLI